MSRYEVSLPEGFSQMVLKIRISKLEFRILFLRLLPGHNGTGFLAQGSAINRGFRPGGV